AVGEQVGSVGFMNPIEMLPLPDDPTLAVYATALNETGHWAEIWDAQWRFVFVTDELRLTSGESFDAAVERLGSHRFASSEHSLLKELYFGDWTERAVLRFRKQAPFVLFDTPGGRDELRRVVDPALVDLVDLVDEIEPVEAPPVWQGRWLYKLAGSSA